MLSAVARNTGGTGDPSLTSARREGAGRVICAPSWGLDLGWEGRRARAGGLWMGQQAATLKWKPGQDMKRTRQGRGWMWDKELFFWWGSWKRGMDAYLCVHARVCLGLPGGEPHALTEGFAYAISCWQRSVWVSLVGAQQEQHLDTHKNTHIRTMKPKDLNSTICTGGRVGKWLGWSPHSSSGFSWGLPVKSLQVRWTGECGCSVCTKPLTPKLAKIGTNPPVTLNRIIVFFKIIMSVNIMWCMCLNKLCCVSSDMTKIQISWSKCLTQVFI